VGVTQLTEVSLDKAKSKGTADTLIDLLLKYASVDQDAALLLSCLSTLLNEARNGTLNAPMPWGAVPGDYFFTERELRQSDDLDRAYAEFKIAATGGEDPTLQKLRLAIGR
jgi:hypothetical protein